MLAPIDSSSIVALYLDWLDELTYSADESHEKERLPVYHRSSSMLRGLRVASALPLITDGRAFFCDEILPNSFNYDEPGQHLVSRQDKERTVRYFRLPTLSKRHTYMSPMEFWQRPTDKPCDRDNFALCIIILMHQFL